MQRRAKPRNERANTKQKWENEKIPSAGNNGPGKCLSLDRRMKRAKVEPHNKALSSISLHRLERTFRARDAGLYICMENNSSKYYLAGNILIRATN